MKFNQLTIRLRSERCGNDESQAKWLMANAVSNFTNLNLNIINISRISVLSGGKKVDLIYSLRHGLFFFFIKLNNHPLKTGGE